MKMIIAYSDTGDTKIFNSMKEAGEYFHVRPRKIPEIIRKDRPVYNDNEERYTLDEMVLSKV